MDIHAPKWFSQVCIFHPICKQTISCEWVEEQGQALDCDPSDRLGTEAF